MRTPSEFVAAAVRKVQSRLMPDCALTMSHGANTATVSRISAHTKGEDESSDYGPAESFRVLALASDFPALMKGDLVSIKSTTETTMNLVTSAKVDAVGASFHVGLSNPLTRHAAVIQGTRNARRLYVQAVVLVTPTGYEQNLADGFSSSDIETFTLVISVVDWNVSTPPRIGDTVRFDYRDASHVVAVTSVETRNGYYNLKARSSK